MGMSGLLRNYPEQCILLPPCAGLSWTDINEWHSVACLTVLGVQLRSQLELAMRTLERGQRREDVDAVEAALAAVQDSVGTAELLADAVKAARKRVEQWQALTASDAKLQRVLRDGASTAQLARAIQEASTAGVKVAAAKRTLKVGVLICCQHRYNCWAD